MFLTVGQKMTTTQWCDLCRKKGLDKKLVPLQINLDEAVLMCQNEACPYPMGADLSHSLLERKYTEIANPRKRKKQKGESGTVSVSSMSKHRKLKTLSTATSDSPSSLGGSTSKKSSIPAQLSFVSRASGGKDLQIARPLPQGGISCRLNHDIPNSTPVEKVRSWLSSLSSVLPPKPGVAVGNAHSPSLLRSNISSGTSAFRPYVAEHNKQNRTSPTVEGKRDNNDILTSETAACKNLSTLEADKLSSKSLNGDIEHGCSMQTVTTGKNDPVTTVKNDIDADVNDLLTVQDDPVTTMACDSGDKILAELGLISPILQPEQVVPGINTAPNTAIPGKAAMSKTLPAEMTDLHDVNKVGNTVEITKGISLCIDTTGAMADTRTVTVVHKPLLTCPTTEPEMFSKDTCSLSHNQNGTGDPDKCNDNSSFPSCDITSQADIPPVNLKSDCKLSSINFRLAEEPECQDGDILFPQWYNEDALCWLDVIMCLIVHNKTIRHSLSCQSPGGSLWKLIEEYDRAVDIVRKVGHGVLQGSHGMRRRQSDPDDNFAVKTGGGHCWTVSGPVVTTAQTGQAVTVVRAVNDSENVRDDKDGAHGKVSAHHKSADTENASELALGKAQSFGNLEMKRIMEQSCVECGEKTNSTNQNTSSTIFLEKGDGRNAVTVTKRSRSGKVTKSHICQLMISQLLAKGGQVIQNGHSLGDDTETKSGFQKQQEQGDDLVKESLREKLMKVINILSDVRELIWQQLEPRLQCQKGRNDSPVFALPLLVTQNKMEDFFRVDYHWLLQCKVCGYEQRDRHSKVLPTFPSVAPDFSMTNASFLRPCFKCNAASQKRTMHIERYPKVLTMHFVEGLPVGSKVTDLDFSQNGVSYGISGLVQFKTDPDHFAAWVRKGHQWMECDDMKHPLCHFENKEPAILPGEVHIVMWEMESSLPALSTSNSTPPSLSAVPCKGSVAITTSSVDSELTARCNIRVNASDSSLKCTPTVPTDAITTRDAHVKMVNASVGAVSMSSIADNLTVDRPKQEVLINQGQVPGQGSLSGQTAVDPAVLKVEETTKVDNCPVSDTCSGQGKVASGLTSMKSSVSSLDGSLGDTGRSLSRCSTPSGGVLEYVGGVVNGKGGATCQSVTPCSSGSNIVTTSNGLNQLESNSSVVVSQNSASQPPSHLTKSVSLFRRMVKNKPALKLPPLCRPEEARSNDGSVGKITGSIEITSGALVQGYSEGNKMPNKESDTKRGPRRTPYQRSRGKRENPLPSTCGVSGPFQQKANMRKSSGSRGCSGGTSAIGNVTSSSLMMPLSAATTAATIATSLEAPVETASPFPSLSFLSHGPSSNVSEPKKDVAGMFTPSSIGGATTLSTPKTSVDGSEVGRRSSPALSSVSSSASSKPYVSLVKSLLQKKQPGLLDKNPKTTKKGSTFAGYTPKALRNQPVEPNKISPAEVNSADAVRSPTKRAVQFSLSQNSDGNQREVCLRLVAENNGSGSNAVQRLPVVFVPLKGICSNKLTPVNKNQGVSRDVLTVVCEKKKETVKPASGRGSKLSRTNCSSSPRSKMIPLLNYDNYLKSNTTTQNSMNYNQSKEGSALSTRGSVVESTRDVANGPAPGMIPLDDANDPKEEGEVLKELYEALGCLDIPLKEIEETQVSPSDEENIFRDLFAA
ncbi:uncharacterized protein LOC106156272 isoform X1 [Lingula anatina]|uniref:Uncharacterized protein LOC106156272 isoform X1 n=2 Tax=Lingula anatina TaxID=7574 RepID=A0A1S3HLM1_LINAN|nr:uncharacterized protein LOC106156272 isoform X1 [Lingula anatina]|eukprot:XP_013386917.1 uncharacterized protein LOC106156272 isoform X1 [Lingula anatina]